MKQQKLKEGKDLIRYFCAPCIPRKANDRLTRNLPHHAPEKWERFKTYNKRDVDIEQAIQKRLANYPVPDTIWEEYVLDQTINDRGVAIDLALVDNAIEMNTCSKAELIEQMKTITQLDNPNSVAQMKKWLACHGMPTDSLDKKQVAALIQTAPPRLREALELRRQLAKSSVKKYQAMREAVCKDARARGCFQFFGANRTGR